jgi:CheY-like chemotaxis protein
MQPVVSMSRRILIADDLADSVDSLAMLLQMMGHEVWTARDGIEALAAAEEHRPDVVLMDLGMPRMDGYEACRRMREAPWGRELLLVALTGWGQKEDRRRTAEAGFDHHMVKPVEPAGLLQLIEAKVESQV